jgi:glutamate racemase
MMDPSGPVGVFDSGIGGLSVAAAIRRLMPLEDIVYIGDSAHVPYGGHPDGFIRERAIHLADRLVTMGAKAIVIACNTATAAAATELRERLAVPVVAMEPAVKPAALATRSGVVGVLATAGTLASARFAGLLDRFGEGIEVLTEPCADLVELVERGETDGPEVSGAVEAHVRPLIDAGADTLILGCTHFPFLRALIEARAGPGVVVIDTEDAVARQLSRKLSEFGLLDSGGGGLALFTSGDPERFTDVARRLWAGAPRARSIV